MTLSPTRPFPWHFLSLAALAACSPAAAPPDAGAHPAGAGALPPSAYRPAFPTLLVDPNQGGNAAAVHVVGIAWGRLVDVYDLDPASGARALVHADFLIGEDVASDGVDYELRTLHGSQETQLTILHPRGSAAYELAFQALQQGLAQLPDHGGPLPPPMVPRNAALELRFDDLLDPDTVNAQTVKLFVGYPPDAPFEVRVLADPNHGDLADPDGDGLFELFPTRVIVDFAVSELEALESDPPLSVNPLGLPAAETAAVPNARLRLPTRTDPQTGQTEILRNLAGNGLAFTGNGSNDPSAPTADVVRAFRSGGESDQTGDASNGFLIDADPPALVGHLPVTLSGDAVADPRRPGVFTFPSMLFTGGSCEPSPEEGDGLAIGALLAVVEAFAQQDGALVSKLRIRVVHPRGATPAPGPAILSTLFEPAMAECFLAFDPAAGIPPNQAVSPSAAVALSFSEPMRAASLAPLDGFAITSVPADPGAFDHVVGEVQPTADRRTFRFVPAFPFPHVLGTSETWYVQLATGAAGATDLAGNPLAPLGATLLFTIDPAAPSTGSGNLVLRFETLDELYGDGLHELRGQFRHDPIEGAIRPRPVHRFSYAADDDKPLPGAMTPFPPGVQTPLVPFGSKLQTVRRYVDLGWSAPDESFVNVDVEGLAWAPVAGQVVNDHYDEFQISLGHSRFLPDEAIDPQTGFPLYPSSGLVKTFAQNYTASEEGAGTVVHPRERGYTVSPADLFVSESGKSMVPWPLNRGVPPSEFRYYTWRDTALLDAAAPFGAGVPLLQEVLVLGLPVFAGSIYPAGSVRSIGLPLLVEYRCYPDFSALGLNPFEVLLAANSSIRPNFRAFSSGGFDVNNQPVIRDPDLQDEALGGFNPNSSPPGIPTPGVENVFYVGQVDLVTRVSRAHSIWLPAGGAGSIFAAPLVLPSPAEQPPGTALSIAWRGASAILPGGGPSGISADAGQLDAYGDPAPQALGEPVFLNGDATWKDDLTDLDSAAWVQFRLTFVADAHTGLTPMLSTLGIAFTQQ